MNSMFPSSRQRPASPVRYMREPGCRANGSAIKRCAVAAAAPDIRALHPLTDVQLSLYPDQHRPQMLIQNVYLHVRYWLTMGASESPNEAGSQDHLGIHGDLGGSVEIDQFGGASSGDLPDYESRQHFAAAEYCPQIRCESESVTIRKHRYQRWNSLQDRDPGASSARMTSTSRSQFFRPSCNRAPAQSGEISSRTDPSKLTGVLCKTRSLASRLNIVLNHKV